eukprot:TRINITY_DN27292_c0_g1_i1.p1 TRINITY_DN27292_c0_g1~~TRINITY_DN27292_c0_g1_i1.p1  ORF type:complete len:517 (+),score=89.61 TRINITY_DN27292_c0_g1_i1:221-1771(+)
MPEQDAPPIGGIVVSSHQSEYLLTPEVVLFEPSPADIHRGGSAAPAGKPGTRLIFLNTPLTTAEQRDLEALHQAVEKEQVLSKLGDSAFPYWVRIHALRILQQSKGRYDKAIAMMLTHLELRVKKIPVMENTILQDLKDGFVYFHGRDRSCRPVVVLRFDRISRFSSDVDRAFKVMFFVFEFAVRHLMVPGRVENWVCLIDLKNSAATISALRICKDIGRLLEEVFCGRNFCTKIFHLPWIIRAVVMAFIPEDKKSKVEFVSESDIPGVMRKLCEPHQLEQQYGGTAPNVARGQAYPFRFFPHCRGSGSGSPHESLHSFADRKFHEGHLWDASQGAKSEWQEGAQQQALTPGASAALHACIQKRVEPCRTLERWLEIVNPAEAERRKESKCPGSDRLKEEITADKTPQPKDVASTVSGASTYEAGCVSTSETEWAEKDVNLKALTKASAVEESFANAVKTDSKKAADLAWKNDLDDNDLKPTDYQEPIPEVTLNRSGAATQTCCLFCESSSTRLSL